MRARRRRAIVERQSDFDRCRRLESGWFAVGKLGALREPMITEQQYSSIKIRNGMRKFPSKPSLRDIQTQADNRKSINNGGGVAGGVGFASQYSASQLAGGGVVGPGGGLGLAGILNRDEAAPCVVAVGGGRGHAPGALGPHQAVAADPHRRQSGIPPHLPFRARRARHPAVSSHTTS
jgi:hypothetical protein